MAVLTWLYKFCYSLGKIEFCILTLILLKVLYNIHSILFVRSQVESKIPSPPRWPILRHLPALIRKGGLPNLIKEFLPRYSKNGLMRIDIRVSQEAIVVTQPEEVKKVLVSESYKLCRTKSMEIVFPVFERGVAFSRHKEHAWQRKLLGPAFTLNSTIAYIDIFHKHAEELAQRLVSLNGAMELNVWKNKVTSSSFTPCQFAVDMDLELVTFDITGAAIFGYQFGSLANEKDGFARSCETLLTKGCGYKNVAVAKYLGFLKPFIRIKFTEEIDQAYASVKEGLLQIIDTRRKKLSDHTAVKLPNSKPDLLTKMIKLQDEDTGERFDEAALLGNVLSLALAGFDTSSTCLTWTLYLLSKHQDEQEKARKEVLSAIGDKREITFQDLEKMPYVTAVIKESLRLHPPAGVATREICESITLGGIEIPVGYDIYVPIDVLQQSNRYWSDPKSFRPERFITSDDTEAGWDLRQKLLAFSMGPRGCIGSKFAMLEMRVIISVLLKYFRFTFPSDHPEVKAKTILTTKPHPTPRLQVELV